jgi:hypothetical protein
MVLAQSDNQDRLLNAAITGANFKEGIESYLDIVDAFYSEDVEIIVGEDTEPVRGRGNLGARLYEFLAPIRVIGGLSISIRSIATPAAGGYVSSCIWNDPDGYLVGPTSMEGRQSEL